jgi:hypothetical protein
VWLLILLLSFLYGWDITVVTDYQCVKSVRINSLCENNGLFTINCKQKKTEQSISKYRNIEKEQYTTNSIDDGSHQLILHKANINTTEIF